MEKSISRGFCSSFSAALLEFNNSTSWGFPKEWTNLCRARLSGHHPQKKWAGGESL
jgi:hypothetical protein